MKFKYSKQLIRIGALSLSFVIFFVSVLAAHATKTVDQLEAGASGLESELSDLESELKSLDNELNQILSQIKNTNSELKTIREELALAKGKEEAQYESMMTRIKYMYENGNSTILELLFNSSCLAEFVSRAEFFSAINEYDRKLLKEYSDNHELIAEKEAKLKDTQEYLHSLQTELTSKEQDINNKILSTSAELSDYTAKLEKAKAEAKKAEEAAKEEIKPIPPEKPEVEKPSIEITDGTGVKYTEADVELLAALLECEAGTSNYDALLAVGSVVVNRMKSRYYPNTVEGVVYQSGQFPPATNGKMDKILEQGVKALCLEAAQDALNGKNNVGDCLQFRSASSGREGLIIGDNVFF